jgi:hypothetical protein
LLIDPLRAQEDCAFTLSRAQRLYDAGNIEQIPLMLKQCMESGFTKEERQQAQKLIVLSYLFDKNEYEAERAMLDFLRKYPEYELNTSDQAEFVQLFNSFITLPVVSIGVIGGGNLVSAQTGKTFGVCKYPGNFSAKTPGFQGGISFQIYLKNKLDLNIEAIYQQGILDYQNDSIPGNNLLKFTETRTSLAVPISLIYTPIHLKKINPFLRIGANFEYLLSSNAKIIRQDVYSIKPATEPELSMMDNRKNFQIQAFGGIGVTYKLKHSFLLLECRYHQGFMSQTKNKVQLDAPNPNLTGLYYLAENDYALSHFSINVGLFYKIYKPRKK